MAATQDVTTGFGYGAEVSRWSRRGTAAHRGAADVSEVTRRRKSPAGALPSPRAAPAVHPTGPGAPPG
ncbi:hypothetical protein WQO_05500 [Streptomyces globisporus C-1027]|uniref:Uncharacterized protein n=1 Tax=Streptomyces globisporus C-1027 TaxID=1172567 RepID=A0A0U3K113_STRGL|nr:hypothetical protein WQO_05500 [Streptomyces globisporus C-1027]